MLFNHTERPSETLVGDLTQGWDFRAYATATNYATAMLRATL